MTDDLENVKQQLQDALDEIEKLRKKNARLKQTATPPVSTSVIKHKVKVHQPASTSSKIHSQSSAEEKIALFRQLFRGREDVIFPQNDRHQVKPPVSFYYFFLQSLQGINTH